MLGLSSWTGHAIAWPPGSVLRIPCFACCVKAWRAAAQTALRFLLQNDAVVIPKSTHKERIQQSFALFGFTLTSEDMARIEALDGGESLFFSHYDPKTVEWFMSFA